MDTDDGQLSDVVPSNIVSRNVRPYFAALCKYPEGSV